MYGAIFQKLTEPFSRGGQEVPRSWWSVVPSLLVFALFWSAVFASLTTFLADFLLINHPLSPLSFLAVATLFLWVILPVGKMLNYYDEINAEGVLSVDGLIGLRVRERFIEFDEIIGVELRQSLLDRVFDIGTIIVSPGRSGVRDLYLEKIVTPNQYLAMIEYKVDATRGIVKR